MTNGKKPKQRPDHSAHHLAQKSTGSKTNSQQNSAENGLASSPLETQAQQVDFLNDPRLAGQESQRTQYVQNLQKQHGNAYVQRMLGETTGSETPEIQRALGDSAFSWLDKKRHDLMETVGLESADEAEKGRATAFYAHGKYGPEAIIGAGGHGGFDASYDPVSGVEKITIKGAVEFQDGLKEAGGVITPYSPDLQTAATTAASLAGPAQAEYISQYQWTAAQKTPWLSQLISTTESMWSNQHEFFINKPHWEWLTANIVVDIDLRAVDPGESRADDDHLFVTTVREPAGSADVGAQVDPGFGDNAFDQTMRLSSSDVNPRNDNLLAGGKKMTIYFEHDSAALTPAATAKLDVIIATYQGAPGHKASNPTSIMLEAFTSASGSAAYNEALALRRSDAVSTYLGNNGFTNINDRAFEIGSGESEAIEGADEAQQASERRVEVTIDSGEAQIVAAHEFGHAFGLDDEYAVGAGSRIGGTGAVAGTPTAHDPLTRNMTDAKGNPLAGAIHENNEGIMSLGNVVRPQHYSTFHKALTTVTGINEWALSPAP